MTLLLWIFVILLLLKTLADSGLDILNLRAAMRNRDAVPDGFAGFMDADSYRKSIDYTVAKLRFGLIESCFSTIVLAVIVISGFLPWLFAVFTDWFGVGCWGQGLTLIAVFTVLSLPSIPFDAWSTFKIEAEFGFNRTSISLWIIDKIKGFFISLCLAWPLLALLIAFVSWFPLTWWLWGFLLFFGFQLLMAVIYPMWIMPLFNKLEPLPEGELKTALFALAERTGFKAKTILVIDGSRRSAHSNAFFAGFGRFRRIVLYDTLMKQLQTRQLEAVLAHEIGHYKLGHIPKMLLLSAIISLAVFGLLGVLSHWSGFVAGFGFDVEALPTTAPTLLLFMLLAGLVGFWLSPLTHRRSRKHEYEADDFARDAMQSPQPLIEALQCLHKENLSNPTPHPLYSAFHYSHPVVLERIRALNTPAS
jgi:STE24 endopeptidase